MNKQLLQKAREYGTDEQYLAWIRTMPSALTGEYSEWVDGEGRNPACHVRRSLDSGIAHKPEYSAIPLTHDEHAMQHQKGESVFCPPEWYDAMAVKYLCDWINGVKPPPVEEQKASWKKEFELEYSGQMVGLYLLVKRHFKNKDADRLKITIQRASKRRSNAQNRAQWGVIYNQMLEFYQKNQRAFFRDSLAWLQLIFNREQLKADFIHELCKGLHNEGKSTAKLTKLESCDYFKEIQRHFHDEYDYIIKEPVNPSDYRYYNET